MKLYQAIELPRIFAALKNKTFPIRTSYKLSKISKRVEEEVKFYQDKVGELTNEYGERDSEGAFVFGENKQTILIQKDKIEECQKKINDLLQIEIEPITTRLTIDELEDASLTMEEVEMLMPLIEEE